jgi:hypothetical protein
MQGRYWGMNYDEGRWWYIFMMGDFVDFCSEIGTDASSIAWWRHRVLFPLSLTAD